MWPSSKALPPDNRAGDGLAVACSNCSSGGVVDPHRWSGTPQHRSSREAKPSGAIPSPATWWRGGGIGGMAHTEDASGETAAADTVKHVVSGVRPTWPSLLWTSGSFGWGWLASTQPAPRGPPETSLAVPGV